MCIQQYTQTDKQTSFTNSWVWFVNEEWILQVFHTLTYPILLTKDQKKLYNTVTGTLFWHDTLLYICCQWLFAIFQYACFTSQIRNSNFSFVSGTKNTETIFLWKLKLTFSNLSSSTCKGELAGLFFCLANDKTKLPLSIRKVP